MEPKYFSYVVSRDYGFAPNPFYNICTLATCKPGIRRTAQIGDWIFGINSLENGNNNLIYAMKVTRKMTFNEYWDDPSFLTKKPVMNGSLKQMYGDNIYHFDPQTLQWQQENSHHSLSDGSINLLNLNRDTSSNNVLISDYFFYFGIKNIELPSDLLNEIRIARNYKLVRNHIGENIVSYLKERYQIGYYGNPILFKNFSRYDGK